MPDRQKTDGQRWYTRRSGETKGPFPEAMVRRFVLLGRLGEDDEVSLDGRSWRSVGEVDALIPEEMAQLETEEDRQRLLLARLRADERVRERRDGDGDTQAGERRRGADRRGPEPDEMLKLREARKRLAQAYAGEENNRGPMALLVGLLLVVLGGGLYAYTQLPAADAVSVNCGAGAAPGVNWSNCQLEGLSAAGAELDGARVDNADLRGANFRGADLNGIMFAYTDLSTADLSYTDLSSAVLTGAGLRHADLSYSELTGADLSYADLRGASLGGADLTGAKLTKTIWMDGRVCAPQSVGRCN